LEEELKTRAALIVSSAAVLIGTIFGCSSSTTDTGVAAASAGNCPAAGSKVCTNDSAQTQADVDQCTQLRADAKCGSKFVDVLKCAGANVSCLADGKPDEAKFLAACKSQSDAYQACAIPSDAGAD